MSDTVNKKGIDWSGFSQVASGEMQQAQRQYLEAMERATNYQYLGQAQAQGQRADIPPEPACSVKVCGTECAALRSELLEAQDQIAALGEERDALRGELGDAKGAADSWRSRAERAEKALDMLKVKR